MATPSPMGREEFLRLAAATGLNADSAHMDELFSYVQAVLDGLRSLQDLDVTAIEPDMAFEPHRE